MRNMWCKHLAFCHRTGVIELALIAPGLAVLGVGLRCGRSGLRGPFDLCGAFGLRGSGGLRVGLLILPATTTAIFHLRQRAITPAETQLQLLSLRRLTLVVLVSVSIALLAAFRCRTLRKRGFALQ